MSELKTLGSKFKCGQGRETCPQKDWVMYGIYINNSSIVSPYIGVYPTLELIATVIQNMTSIEITSREISAAFVATDAYVFRDKINEIVVTELSKELIDMCAKYDGSPMRVKVELLNRK